jgi:murein DD-endopeptidase MepM/ murein hydrolase activator NlpD
MVLRFFYFLVIFSLAVGAGLFYFENGKITIFDRTPPEIKWIKAPKLIGLSGGNFSFKIPVDLSGIKNVTISTKQKGEWKILKSIIINELQRIVKFKVDSKNIDYNKKNFLIKVKAVDNSLWSNSKSLIHKGEIDFIPPIVGVISTHHYLQSGGSLVVKLSATKKDLKSAGIKYNEEYFNAFPLSETNSKTQDKDSAIFGSIVAVPFPNEELIDFKLYAKDKAGNVSTAEFPFSIKTIARKSAKMELSKDYLEKIKAKFTSLILQKKPEILNKYSGEEQLIAIFKYVNEVIRKENIEVIQRTVAESSSKPLWDGVFHKPLAAEMTASFGEMRTYYLGNKVCGESIHEGYDLAHLNGSKVSASNRGKILFSGDLGIYGNTILIDHGMGITTLYGHLSSIHVSKNMDVMKDQIIGLTGSSGLAGGDHLHYEIRVAGKAVTPKEWMDPNWFKTRINEGLFSKN